MDKKLHKRHASKQTIKNQDLQRQNHLTKHLAISVFISLFLIFAFAAINSNVTGQAVLSPTPNPTANILLSFVVPFLFFTVLFVLILTYVQKSVK